MDQAFPGRCDVCGSYAARVCGRRSTPPSRQSLAGLCVAVSFVSFGLAQAAPAIYTCIDANGRRITSDRVIPQCLDREQQELYGSGGVKRSVAPALSAQEQERQQRAAAQAEERARKDLADARRDRALLIRYPDAASHERARQRALADVDQERQRLQQRWLQLQTDAKAIDREFEFYPAGASAAPTALVQKRNDNRSAQASLREQQAEQDRAAVDIATRFDGERERLQPLWSATAGH